MNIILYCNQHGCPQPAQWSVTGRHANLPACHTHLAAVRRRCGEPTSVRPLRDAPEPDQPDLFTEEADRG